MRGPAKSGKKAQTGPRWPDPEKGVAVASIGGYPWMLWVGCGDAEIDGGGGRDGDDWRDGRAGARQCSRVGADLRANRASRADSRTPFRIQRARSTTRSHHAWQRTLDRRCARTRVAVPPRPLFGYETAPIVSVRTIESDSQLANRGRGDWQIRLRDRAAAKTETKSFCGSQQPAPIRISRHRLSFTTTLRGALPHRSRVRSHSRRRKIHVLFLSRNRSRPRPVALNERQQSTAGSFPRDDRSRSRRLRSRHASRPPA